MRPTAGTYCVVAGFRSEEVAADHAFRRIRPPLHLRLEPLRAGRCSPFGRVDGRAAARRGGRGNHRPLRRLPLHGLGRAPRDGGIGRPGWRKPNGWRVEPLGHGRLAVFQFGGRFPLSPHRAAAAARRRFAGHGRRAGQGIRPAAGGGTRRARILAGHRRGGDGPRAALRLGPPGRRPLRFRTRQDTRGTAGAASRRRAAGTALPHRRVAASRTHCGAWSPRPTAYSTWPTTSTPPAAANRPCNTPCRPPARRGRSIRWKSPNSNTASPTAAPSSADRTTQFAIAEGLGDVLMLRGRYDEAAECFHRAAGLGDGDFARAKIQGKIGELAFKRGDMESATLAFESTLRLLGKPCRGGCHWFLPLAAFGKSPSRRCTRCFPGLFVHRRKRQPTPAELLGFRMFSRLAHGYWFVRGRFQSLVGPPSRHEPRGTLSAHRRTGPGLFGACAGHEPHRILQPRHRLRGEVAGTSPLVQRSVGRKGSRCTSTAFCCTPLRDSRPAWRNRARPCGFCSGPATIGK